MKFIIPNDPKDIPFSTRFRWWKSEKAGSIINVTRKIIKKESLFVNVNKDGNCK